MKKDITELYRIPGLSIGEIMVITLMFHEPPYEPLPAKAGSFVQRL